MLILESQCPENLTMENENFRLNKTGVADDSCHNSCVYTKDDDQEHSFCLSAYSGMNCKRCILCPCCTENCIFGFCIFGRCSGTIET